jgi:hypothetical protein
VKRRSFLDVLVRSEPFRVFQIGLGVLLMLVAPIIGIPAPGPLGTFIFAFGLALVLRNSSWARRRYVRYTRRYPRLQRAVNFGLRRKTKRRAPVPTPLAAVPPALALPTQTANES